MNKSNVCPWWMGYLLLIPLRKLTHSPKKILSPYIQSGMTVLDYGSAMGYFSLPMAKMVGQNGKVYCFDIQEKLLRKLTARAEKQGLQSVVIPVAADKNPDIYHQLEQAVDFALLFAVAHEVPDQHQLFVDLYSMLKPGSFLYFAEPAGHVSLVEFKHSLALATLVGFTIHAAPEGKKKLCRLLLKPQA